VTSRLALLLPALLALLARLATGPHPIDDAYITFRYARNLADGLGLVYNPGEWVLGTTAPLWAVILGAGYRLGLTDLPWLATVLSGLCDAASAALLVCPCAASPRWSVPKARCWRRWCLAGRSWSNAARRHLRWSPRACRSALPG
jgi:hypothetical protein